MRHESSSAYGCAAQRKVHEGYERGWKAPQTLYRRFRLPRHPQGSAESHECNTSPAICPLLFLAFSMSGEWREASGLSVARLVSDAWKWIRPGPIAYCAEV